MLAKCAEKKDTRQLKAEKGSQSNNHNSYIRIANYFQRMVTPGATCTIHHRSWRHFVRCFLVLIYNFSFALRERWSNIDKRLSQRAINIK